MAQRTAVLRSRYMEARAIQGQLEISQISGRTAKIPVELWKVDNSCFGHQELGSSTFRWKSCRVCGSFRRQLSKEEYCLPGIISIEFVIPTKGAEKWHSRSPLLSFLASSISPRHTRHRHDYRCKPLSLCSNITFHENLARPSN
jgi:hypothetical protein